MAFVIKKSKTPKAKKPVAKKSVAKKSVAKKPATKKPVAKKLAAKKPVAKKKIAKKPIAKKPIVKKVKPERVRRLKKKPNFVRVPLRIARRPTPTKAVNAAPVPVIDTAKAVAFAMSIAQEMKRSAAKQEKARVESEIRLTRRPVTRTRGANTEKFPKADLKEFRRRLLEARDKALSGANAMKATGFNEAEDHEADGGDGTNQTLRLQALGQMGLINRTLQQIEEALHRIDDGSYGVCTVCGQLIRKPRLMNQPFVMTCMECQSDMERNRQ